MTQEEKETTLEHDMTKNFIEEAKKSEKEAIDLYKKIKIRTLRRLIRAWDLSFKREDRKGRKGRKPKTISPEVIAKNLNITKINAQHYINAILAMKAIYRQYYYLDKAGGFMDMALMKKEALKKQDTEK